MLIKRLLLEDSPVRTLAGDLLDRRSFVESLADTLILPPEAHCRVISLEGAWGEGKTSAIEMALDLIGARDADLRPFVVRINPWQLGTKDALTRALLLELSRIVRGEGRREKAAALTKLSDEILTYLSALSFLKTEPNGATLALIAKVALWAAEKLARRDLDLQAKKKRVSEAIKKANRPIIIIVDDLDRLLPEEVLEVIRFVRAVGDFERTTYLLAFDHPRVIESLSKAGIPSAERFLEKIIQLRAHLPPTRARLIKKILEEKIESSQIYVNRRLFEESESRRIELYSFYMEPLIRDIRTLIRVLSKVEMTPVAVAREVEYWEIFALSLISIVAPEIFEFIRTHPSLLTKGFHGTPRTIEEDKEESIEGHLSELLYKHQRRQAVYLKGLIHSLFPLTSKRSIRSQSWLDRNGRVAAENRLLAFLLSGIFDGEIPTDTVRAIITEDRFRDERILSVTQQEEHLLSLMSSIRDEISISNINPDNPGRLALSLFRRSLDLPDKEHGYGERIQRAPESMLPLLVDLLKRDINSNRTLFEIMKDDRAGILSSLLLEEIIHNKKEPDADKIIIDASEIEKAKEILESKIYFAVENYTDSDEERTGPLLFSLKRIDKVQYEKCIRKLIDSKKNRHVLIKSLANSIHSSHHGRVAVWNHDLVPKDLITHLEREAKEVISGDIKDKALLAGARALIEGREIVVETGDYR